ncbi:uncharacterized protein LOC143463281 [Clavelina lepadiformis]|uniref:uncharacterized protein LOC143463281 n=1 Tax=Clavelina lepadiformis TaxID=159417 RepID=UPI004042F5C2
MKLLLCVLVLFGGLALLSDAGKGGKRRKKGKCRWCFESDSCFFGQDEDDIAPECQTCLNSNCENYFADPFHTRFGVSCIKEAWQGNCSSVCGNWQHDRRLYKCQRCLSHCERKIYYNFDNYCVTKEGPDESCGVCFNETSCFAREEYFQKVPRFCGGYIKLSCENTTVPLVDCVVEAIQDECSRCENKSELESRVRNCHTCLEDCRAERQRNLDCADNTSYPETIPCKFCAALCRASNPSDPPSCMQTNCPDCANCDSCVNDSKSGDQDYDNPSYCRCHNRWLYWETKPTAGLYYDDSY